MKALLHYLETEAHIAACTLSIYLNVNVLLPLKERLEPLEWQEIPGRRASGWALT